MLVLKKTYSKSFNKTLASLDLVIEERIEYCRKIFSHYADEPFFLTRAKDEDSMLGGLYLERTRILKLAIPEGYELEDQPKKTI